jgi:hypothetical protein
MLFMTVGGGFAVFGGYQLWSTRAFLQDASPVLATITDPRERCDDDGCTYWPEMRFNDDTGQMHWLRTRHGSSDYRWSEGTEITALYNPAYRYLRVPGATNLWLLGGAFFGLGSLVFVLGVWLMARLVFGRLEKG